MTIAEAREKCKTFIARLPRDVLIIAILILASSVSFAFGYLAGTDVGQGIHSTNSAQNGIMLESSPFAATTSATGQVVASKNGTKYYLPSCAGSNKISDANKIWFVSASAAAQAGYAPAANCKGF